ncbi:MAG: trypsin-like serine protease [Verrucomicrobiaceae bacterium]|nr:MAG: trypsin-like serine protease [Verrucomicrobiaceae bacterium]
MIVGSTPENASHSSETLSLEQLAKKAEQTVFKIEVMDSRGESLGFGTAFAISESGLLATNYHVIEHGRKFIARTTAGATHRISSVVRRNPTADLAILQMETSRKIQFLESGDSESLRTGTSIAVFGAPEGFSGTLTEGVISARRVDASMMKSLPNLGDLIQISAPISSGSSGSPVLDSHGRVVGVVCALLSGNTRQNLNFAIPVSALDNLRQRPEGYISLWERPDPRWNQSENDRARGHPYARKAEEFSFKKDYSEALHWTEKLLGEFEYSAYPLSAAASLNFKLSNFREARKLAYQALKFNSSDYEALLICGMSEFQDEQYLEAYHLLNRAVLVEPRKTAPYSLLALSAIQSYDKLEAIKAIDKLRKLDSKEADEFLISLSLSPRLNSSGKAVLLHFKIPSLHTQGLKD